MASAFDLEQLGRCPVCGDSARALLHDDCTDLVFGSTTEDFRLWQCRRCRCAYLDPRPDAATIGRAYRTYYTHDAEDAPAPRAHASMAWAIVNGYLQSRYRYPRKPSWPAAGSLLVPLLPMLRWKLDYFARHQAPPTAPGELLLDYGCGNGEFMARAAAAGWSVCGYEWDESAADAARQRGLKVATGDLADSGIAPASVSRITMAHVVEHLLDPRAGLQDCLRLLRPGGSIWIATPSVHALSHRVYGSSWRGLETPRHVVVFDVDALVGLLREVGFVDARVVRRGAHARQLVAQSEALLRARTVVPAATSRIRRLCLPPLVDLLAQFSPRLGEEIVVVAARPAPRST